jgi:hypothetical protein
VINLRVRRSTTNKFGQTTVTDLPSANVTVSFRPTDPSCGPTVKYDSVTTTSAALMPTTGTGGPADRAFPKGSYIVCVDDNAASPMKVEKTIDNSDPNGTVAPSAATDVVVPAAGSAGSC